MESAGATVVSRTIPVHFLERATQHPDRVAMRSSAAANGASVITWGTWYDLALRFAAAVINSSARNTRSVAILAGNDFHWPVADIGTLLCGKTSVGIYPTSAPVQIERMLVDSAAGVLVVDSREQLDVVLAMRDKLPALEVIITTTSLTHPETISWDEWLAIGAAALTGVAGLREVIEAGARLVRREDPAIIIYTSGSTGEPKGAVLSHGCIEASAQSIREALGLLETDTTLSFLAFSHAAERITGMYTRIVCGMEAMLVEDASYLWQAAASYRPTLFGGMPRYYEKLLALSRAEDVSANEILGGRVRLATSGGAALSTEVAEELAKRGITVLGAYGLTEHLCVSFNRPGDPTFDTSGTAMPGTEIRIAADGEILVRRCELTFSSYNNMPEDTRAVFTDDGESLRTGDLGRLDSSGRLRVTGRKKELLALSNGKMVAPLPIEAKLAAHPLIANAVLHAEGRQFVSALIVLRTDSLEAWAKAEGITGSHDELAAHPRVAVEIQKAVDQVNATLSRAESIRRFVTIGRELSVDASELTPTHKVRRNAVLEKYSAQLDALYAT
ncbi:MAG: AMP-dependent synthetase/ligase [Gemmatimonadaceae bacterium]